MKTAQLIVVTEDLSLMSERYKRLLGLVAACANRHLVGVAVALVPVVVFPAFVAPLAPGRWNADAPYLEVDPAATLVTITGAASSGGTQRALSPALDAVTVRIDAGSEPLLLSDPDFVFVLAFFLTSTAGWLRSRRWR